MLNNNLINFYNKSRIARFGFFGAINTVIGFITDKSQDSLLIDKNNSAVRIAAQGWKHF